MIEQPQTSYASGEPVWWLWQPYLQGYAGSPVIAIFVMEKASRKLSAGIAVKMHSGEWQAKWVKMDYIEKRIPKMQV